MKFHFNQTLRTRRGRTAGNEPRSVYSKMGLQVRILQEENKEGVRVFLYIETRKKACPECHSELVKRFYEGSL